MKTKLIFVRHGVTDANISDKFLGALDVELSKIGYMQAKAVAKRLSKDETIDAIYSSDLKRTMQTAKYVALYKNLPIIEKTALREINFGEWEGKTHEEIAQTYPDEFLTWVREPHMHKTQEGESIITLQKRLVKEVNKIIEENQGKTVVIVSHGACIRVLMCYFYGLSINNINKVSWSDNCSLSIVEIENNASEVVSIGDNKHITGDLKLNTYANFDQLINTAEELIMNSRERVAI